MKTIPFLLLTSILISCSSSPNRSQVYRPGWNTLAEESFQRWDNQRLSSANHSDKLVAQCYQGKSDQALERYRDDFDKKDENPYYWLHIGNCYFTKGDTNKAEFYYRLSEAEATNKEIKALSHNNLGIISIKEDNFSLAKWHFEKAIELNDKLRVPAYNLAQLFIHFGHYQAALKLLGQAPLNEGRDLDIQFSLANALLYSGNKVKAREIFDSLPAEALKRHDISLTYAVLLMEEGKIAEARNYIPTRTPSSSGPARQAEKQLNRLIKERTKK